MFDSLENKQAFLRTHESAGWLVRLVDTLPCATHNCLNGSLAMITYWDATSRMWKSTALCQSCVEKMIQVYSQNNGE